jgi:hypothetical protein
MAEKQAQTAAPKRIERKKSVMARVPVGLSFFDENLVLRNPDEPNVPGVVRTDGSPVPRLKLVPLGACAVGFYADDVDELIDALRDSKRVAGWPRRRPTTKTVERPARPAISRARSSRSR